MIDFKIDEHGDICLTNARQYPSFIIDFYIPRHGANKNAQRYAALRIDFDTDVLQYQQTNGLRIDFDTDLHSQTTYPISTIPVFSNEELAQQILIRLKTELGEFTALPSLGSQIILERHEDIRSSVTLERVKEYVLEAIADVDLPEPYTVTVERVDDISRFKYETLKITIDTGRVNLYNATI